MTRRSLFATLCAPLVALVAPKPKRAIRLFKSATMDNLGYHWYQSETIVTQVAEQFAVGPRHKIGDTIMVRRPMRFKAL